MENTFEREVIFYVLRHPFTFEVRYVGKTVEKLTTRLRRHFDNGKGHIGNWVKDLARIGLKPIIQEIGRCKEKENWQEIEKILISEFRAYGYRLCNLCDGGIGASGFKRNERECQNISLRNSVKVFSMNIETKEIKEYKSAREAAYYNGVSQPAITTAIKKKGAVKGNLYSKTKSFEQTEISKSYRVPVICVLPNGDNKKYNSARAAGIELGLCPSFIRKVCRGEYKHYKNHKFKYQT